MVKQPIRKSQQHPEFQQQRWSAISQIMHVLGNTSSQTAWALIRLSKPRTKPRTLRHGARDQIFQAPSPFFGGGAWVRG